jgi:hypothetical protein
MRDLSDRRAVLRLLGGEPAHAELQQMAALADDETSRLLKWLDQSGLAIYLAEHLTHSRTMDVMSVQLRAELERRVSANRNRTEELLKEFTRVNQSLVDAGAEFAVLKGFSLLPEFCEDPWLRHQSDIDILVSEKSRRRAQESLSLLGYVVEGEEGSGEVRLGISSGPTASANDFLYDSPRHRQVELHRNFYESVNGVSLFPDEGWQSHVEWKTIQGDCKFPTLDLSYRILGQLLHAFRHVLHGWLRLGWLYEIAQVVNRYRLDSKLWENIERLMQGDTRVREACGVVLRMTASAFGTEPPEFVRQRWMATMRKSLVLWVDNFGMEWMLANFPGNRLSLLLHREFADSALAWQKFRIERSKRRVSAITIGKLANPAFLAQRVREQLEYFLQYLYWNTQVSKQPIQREGSVPHSSR